MTRTALAIRPVSRPPDAVVRPPGSKSITNRALLLAALADGPSEIRGALRADDTDAMSAALTALGHRIEADGTTIRVEPGGGTPPTPGTRVDCRLSGTTSRFVLPLAALGDVPVLVDGLEPLRARPMGPVLDALPRATGAEVVDHGEPGFLPVTVARSDLRGGEVSVDASASSQFLSALLLAGARFPGGLTVRVTGPVVARPFVDLTISVCADFGIDVDESADGIFEVRPGVPRGGVHVVEADATAASYLAAAAAVTGGRVEIDGLGTASIQGDVAFLDVLERMGATVRRSPRATTVVGGSLHGIDVDLSATPDVAQTLAAVAVFAEGPTRVRGVGFIRGHETDRITAVVTELRRLGVEAEATADGFSVVGGPVRPAEIRTYDDHRMAMSFALIGLVVPGIVILDPGVVSKTYPGYFDDLASLGSP